MIARLMRLFVRRGVVVAEACRAWVEDAQDRANDADMAAADGSSTLPILHLASPTYCTATGPRAGVAHRHIGRRLLGGGEGCQPDTLRRARRLQPACGDALPGRGSLAAAAPMRYVTRPAFADDQLDRDGGNRVTFAVKTPWRRVLGCT